MNFISGLRGLSVVCIALSVIATALTPTPVAASTVETSKKVCAIELKGGKKKFKQELEKFQCNAGDVLLIMEQTNLSGRQLEAQMTALRICDLEAPIQTFVAGVLLSVGCIYSGEVLPIVGDKKWLKEGDQL